MTPKQEPFEATGNSTHYHILKSYKDVRSIISSIWIPFGVLITLLLSVTGGFAADSARSDAGVLKESVAAHAVPEVVLLGLAAAAAVLDAGAFEGDELADAAMALDFAFWP